MYSYVHVSCHRNFHKLVLNIYIYTRGLIRHHFVIWRRHAWCRVPYYIFIYTYLFTDSVQINDLNRFTDSFQFNDSTESAAARVPRATAR